VLRTGAALYADARARAIASFVVVRDQDPYVEHLALVWGDRIMTLALSDLRRLDPGARERQETAFLCPSAACHGHRRRTLYANLTSGLYLCQRCGEKGRLREWWEKSAERQQRLRTEHARRVERTYHVDPITQILADHRHDLHGAINALHQYLVSVEAMAMRIPGQDASEKQWLEAHRYHAWVRDEIQEIKTTIAGLARAALEAA